MAHGKLTRLLSSIAGLRGRPDCGPARRHPRGSLKGETFGGECLHGVGHN